MNDREIEKIEMLMERYRQLAIMVHRPYPPVEYTVIGDAVNLSAKLEKHNKTEGCRALALKETYDAALAQGYQPRGEHRALGGVSVGGVVAPVDLVAVA